MLPRKTAVPAGNNRPVTVLVPEKLSHLMLISLGIPLSADDHLPHINRCQVISPKEEIPTEQTIPEHLGMRQITIFHRDIKIVMVSKK